MWPKIDLLVNRQCDDYDAVLNPLNFLPALLCKAKIASFPFDQHTANCVPMEFNDSELEAYLDESLDSARASEIETALRNDPELLKRLSQINGRRDAGIHTLGEIWRRNQVGVPSPEEIEQHLQGSLPKEDSEYIEFRIRELKCVFTIALLQDAMSQRKDDGRQSKSRQEKIYENSADLLNLRKRKKS